MAREIIINAKTQRPGVCNAAETLLVHADVAAGVPARRARRAARRGRRAARRRAHARARRRRAALAEATDADWDTEFLALVLAVRRRGLRRGGHRPRQPPRLRPLRGDRHGRDAERRGRSSSASTPPASTSTPRRASPTAASSGSAPRSATPPRSSTRAARSACASCARSSTSSGRRARPALAAVAPRVGILGGTFNPPHLAHLLSAQEAYVQLGLDRVLLMPVATPPHKEAGATRGRACALELCRLAVEGDDAARGVRPRGPARRPVLHGRYAARTACDAPGGRPDVHRRRRHGRQPPDAGASPRRCSRWHGSRSAEREGVRRGPTSSSGWRRSRAPPSGSTSSTCRASTSLLAGPAAGGRRAPIRYLVPEAVADYIAQRRALPEPDGAPSSTSMTTKEAS